MNPIFVQESLKSYLLEDAYFSDVTTDSISSGKIAVSRIKAKEDLILAGSIFIAPLFSAMDEKCDIEYLKKDGNEVKKGEYIANVSAKDYALLYVERVCLNMLQRMSGIATRTRRFVNLLKGYKTNIVDTRKTTPGFRFFEKYAVKIGGGTNHRMGLFDAALIKDNHIKDAGGIKNAVELVRGNVPFTTKIEVECLNENMVKQAINAEADIIMLDNMNTRDMKYIVNKFGSEAIFEASGNINEDNVSQIAGTGVDYISSGSLIHHAVWMDINMKME